MNCNECGKPKTGKNRGAHGLCGACNARRHRHENPELMRERDKARWNDRRERQNERRKQHYEAHKDTHLANSKEYHKIHAEEIRQQQADYRRQNRETILERNRIYSKTHRDQANQLARLQAWSEKQPREWHLELFKRTAHRRRARKQALPATLTRYEWDAIKDGFDHRCVYCNRQMSRLTQDHIIPLSKGGPYTADNIIPACLSCNSSKQTRDAIDFMASR